MLSLPIEFGKKYYKEVMCNLLKQLNDKFFIQSLNETINNISNIYG